MQGHQEEHNGVFVREVPGGCMCCAAGLPMQVALNQLLSVARPDRLLIEPTGLGHPKEVLQVLTGSSYREALSIQQIVTLVNARHLGDARYTNNDTFNQQIEIADIVVGNKTDLYESDDQDKLRKYVQGIATTHVDVLFTTNGELDAAQLAGPARIASQMESATIDHDHTDVPLGEVDKMPDCGYIKKLNTGEGYNSVGWRFREDMIFRRDLLFSLLSGIDAERVKAVINTDAGVLGYNKAGDTLTEVPLFSRGQSCIEIIDVEISDAWEHQLLTCLEREA